MVTRVTHRPASAANILPEDYESRWRCHIHLVSSLSEAWQSGIVDSTKSCCRRVGRKRLKISIWGKPLLCRIATRTLSTRSRNESTRLSYVCSQSYSKSQMRINSSARTRARAWSRNASVATTSNFKVEVRREVHNSDWTRLDWAPAARPAAYQPNK